MSRSEELDATERGESLEAGAPHDEPSGEVVLEQFWLRLCDLATD